MDAKQIQLLKETHMMEVEGEGGKKSTLGAYMRFCLDGGIDFVTSKDMVVFDDTNNMLHCVAINEDGRSQCDYPVKVISTDYGIVQQVESVYSQKDFEKALKDGFLKDVVSEEKRSAMLAWSRNIRNQAIQPSRPTPYYTIDPTIVPMGNASMPRVDGATAAGQPSSPVVRSASSAAEITKLIESGVLKSGDSVVVDSDVIFEEDFTFKGDGITLRSNGATFNGVLTAEGKDITIAGFTFATANEATDPYEAKGTHMLKVDGNATISGCTFAPTGCCYNAINSTGDLVLEGNNFEGCENHVYNLIEFSQKEDQKIKNVEISYNTFAKGASKNNTISMFQFEDGATINILNNVWEYAANAVRISNYSNAIGVTINCVDNEYKETSDDEYAGFLLAQGTTQNKDMSGITVNLIRLVGPDGKVVTENGTGNDQVWYTYDTEVDPVVKFH